MPSPRRARPTQSPGTPSARAVHAPAARTAHRAAAGSTSRRSRARTHDGPQAPAADLRLQEIAEAHPPTTKNSGMTCSSHEAAGYQPYPVGTMTLLSAPVPGSAVIVTSRTWMVTTPIRQPERAASSAASREAGSARVAPPVRGPLCCATRSILACARPPGRRLPTSALRGARGMTRGPRSWTVTRESPGYVARCIRRPRSARSRGGCAGFHQSPTLYGRPGLA